MPVLRPTSWPSECWSIWLTLKNIWPEIDVLSNQRAGGLGWAASAVLTSAGTAAWAAATWVCAACAWLVAACACCCAAAAACSAWAAAAWAWCCDASCASRRAVSAATCARSACTSACSADAWRARAWTGIGRASKATPVNRARRNLGGGMGESFVGRKCKKRGRGRNSGADGYTTRTRRPHHRPENHAPVNRPGGAMRCGAARRGRMARRTTALAAPAPEICTDRGRGVRRG